MTGVQTCALPISIGELFGELLEEQALIDPEHKYEVSLAAANDSMTADRTMIKQLLHALIDNSVKYTPKGGTIQLDFASDAAQTILTVSDDGIGMDAEHCDHIFERFYRVDPARARATGGMGLGLSIVSVIAQAHNGCVSAKSEPDIGTSVSVIFPK